MYIGVIFLDCVHKSIFDERKGIAWVILHTLYVLTFISLTYWNVLQSITLRVISVVATRRVVDGEGLEAKVFTGTGRLLSGHPTSEPMKGSQQ